MNLTYPGNFNHSSIPFFLGTSGDGVLHKALKSVMVRVGGQLTVRPTTSTNANRDRWRAQVVGANQTSSGCITLDAKGSTSTSIAELRRRSGLTWDQLAHLFGVARRSVHFWVSGKALNASNEEHLARLLAVMRYIDRGDARATRTALMTPLPDGTIPLDLLEHRDFEIVMQRLGKGSGHVIPSMKPLSLEAKLERMPPPPGERVGYLTDNVHHEIGKSRVAKTAKTKSTL